MNDPIRFFKLKQAKRKQLDAQQEMENIISLVKEMYRLAGIPVYEPLPSEWNKLHREGDN